MKNLYLARLEAGHVSHYSCWDVYIHKFQVPVLVPLLEKISKKYSKVIALCNPMLWYADAQSALMKINSPFLQRLIFWPLGGSHRLSLERKQSNIMVTLLQNTFSATLKQRFGKINGVEAARTSAVSQIQQKTPTAEEGTTWRYFTHTARQAPLVTHTTSCVLLF